MTLDIHTFAIAVVTAIVIVIAMACIAHLLFVADWSIEHFFDDSHLHARIDDIYQEDQS